MMLTKYGWMRAGRWMQRGAMALALAVALVEGAGAQGISTTTVQGTVYLANGQAGAGTLAVSWPTFTTAAGQLVVGDRATVTIPADGFVSVNLAPNLGATPAGEYYTATFYMSDGTVNNQYWVVPAAAQATLAQVQAQVMPAAQAVQTVSKAYVDLAVQELGQSMLTSSGGTLDGPLTLSGDPTQPLQAADKHYVDLQVGTALPLAGGTITGALTVGGTEQTTGIMTVRNNADAEVDYDLWPGLTSSQKGSFTYKDWNGNSQWYMMKDASNDWALNSAVGGLDSFKAFQSSNSGDTYIDASNATGHIRLNYEAGSGAETDVYSGSSASLAAAFLGPASIKFPGLAAGSGHDCLQIDNSGYISNTGLACGSGSGTVGSGNSGQIAYYTADGTSLGGTSAVPLTAGGTGASTAAGAMANLLPGVTADGNNGINVGARCPLPPCSPADRRFSMSAARPSPAARSAMEVRPIPLTRQFRRRSTRCPQRAARF
jgi:hypothetical protein